MRIFNQAGPVRLLSGMCWPWWPLGLIALVMPWCMTVGSAPIFGADRILLRKLEVISDRTVVSFDEDGVRLDDGRVITWDEIERASVSVNQQAFDKMLLEIGDPLYRLRQRLAVGDYGGVSQPAEQLWPKFRVRNSKTAYWVSVAVMWSRLAELRREEAVVPYLTAWRTRRALADTGSDVRLPGPRQLQIEESTGFCQDLLPCCWQAEAARRVLPEVGAAIGQLPKPWPLAARIYYATLALSAGEPARAEAALDAGDVELGPWRDVVALQAAFLAGQTSPAITSLQTKWQEWNGPLRMTTLYWLGRYHVERQPGQREQGLLYLLRLAAEYQTGDDPEPIAEALHSVANALEEMKNPVGALAVRTELLDRFSQTRVARALQMAPASRK